MTNIALLTQERRSLSLCGERTRRPCYNVSWRLCELWIVTSVVIGKSESSYTPKPMVKKPYHRRVLQSNGCYACLDHFYNHWVNHGGKAPRRWSGRGNILPIHTKLFINDYVFSLPFLPVCVCVCVCVSVCACVRVCVRVCRVSSNQSAIIGSLHIWKRSCHLYP